MLASFMPHCRFFYRRKWRFKLLEEKGQRQMRPFNAMLVAAVLMPYYGARST